MCLPHARIIAHVRETVTDLREPRNRRIQVGAPLLLPGLGRESTHSESVGPRAVTHGQEIVRRVVRVGFGVEARLIACRLQARVPGVPQFAPLRATSSHGDQPQEC